MMDDSQASNPPHISKEKVFKAAEDYFQKRFSDQNFEPGKTYIPASGKLLDFQDLRALLDSSLDLWLTGGPFAEQFEREFGRALCGTLPGILVNSGSSANLLAISSLVKKGDEVLTTAVAFPTTVNPIIQSGGHPVFVDIDTRTLNVDLEKLFSAKTSKTKGVVLSHTLGNPFPADQIAKWCQENHLYFIEDTCDALGGTLGGKALGTFGDFSTFSFYPAHQITTGEGGMIMAKNAGLRRKVQKLRDWGRDCWCETGKDNTCGQRFDWKFGSLPEGYDHKYVYSELGYNLKATDLQAALGISQLKKLPWFKSRRQKNFIHLKKGLDQSPLLSAHFNTVSWEEKSDPCWFGFPLGCRDSLDRREVVQSLEEKKVGSRPIFAGNLTRHPAYQKQNYRIADTLEKSDEVMKEYFWVGVHPSLTAPHLDYILEQLEWVVKKCLTA